MKTKTAALLLALSLAAPAAAGEFKVPDRLTVLGGVEISTKTGAPALILASSTAYQGKVGIGTDAPASTLTVAGVVEASTGGYKLPDGTWQTTAYAPSVLQTRVYSDYTRRTTGDGGVYYFGGGETDNVIRPYKVDSIILISISYFGETSTHDTHIRLQYRIGAGGWNNFDLANTGQQGTMKVGAYNDTDYNSTPDNAQTQVAKAFNTTEPIYFRMYHFNGGTYYHNNSVSTTYETAPSTLILQEFDAGKSSYSKR